MNMCLIQDVVFDDEATRLMGIALIGPVRHCRNTAVTLRCVR